MEKKIEFIRRHRLFSFYTLLVILVLLVAVFAPDAHGRMLVKICLLHVYALVSGQIFGKPCHPPFSFYFNIIHSYTYLRFMGIMGGAWEHVVRNAPDIGA